MSLAPALVLREGDRERLADLAGLPGVPPGLAERAGWRCWPPMGCRMRRSPRWRVSRPAVIDWPGPLRPRRDQGPGKTSHGLAGAERGMAAGAWRCVREGTAASWPVSMWALMTQLSRWSR